MERKVSEQNIDDHRPYPEQNQQNFERHQIDDSESNKIISREDWFIFYTHSPRLECRLELVNLSLLKNLWAKHIPNFPCGTHYTAFPSRSRHCQDDEKEGHQNSSLDFAEALAQ